ncbi:hypothetical protein CP8484711_0884A, partial [Chlamydia psittaci 84-8471/1]
MPNKASSSVKEPSILNISSFIFSGNIPGRC